MCNPVGAGFLHVRADARDAIYPTIISHGLTAPTHERSRFHQLFDWPGTYDPTAALTLPTTLRIMATLREGGWETIRRANHEKALRARDCIARGLGLAPCAPDELLGSMASLLLPRSLGGFPASDAPIAPLQEHLFNAHRIEAPVWMWNDQHAIVRVSAHLYNDDSKYACLRDALAALRASR
jgi:isopenicillin-N epimerase